MRCICNFFEGGDEAADMAERDHRVISLLRCPSYSKGSFS